MALSISIRSAALILIAIAFIAPTAAFALSCGDTITTSTTLTGSLTNCPGSGLYIGANNVVLDCQGFKISGAPSYGYGVNILSKSNDTIKNCNISGFGQGIRLDPFSPGNTISNNNLSGNDDGIIFFGSSNNISGNIANSNNNRGITGRMGDGNNIVNNTVSSNGQPAFHLAGLAAATLQTIS